MMPASAGKNPLTAKTHAMGAPRAFLEDVEMEFARYRLLGLRSLERLTSDQLFLAQESHGNPAAVIVQHLCGNMRSRWTDFLTTDGEKPWRNRDREFEPILRTREEVIAAWEAGWDTLMDALQALSDLDLERIVYIRGEAHSIRRAILRQLTHYPYHVGQLVHIAKACATNGWDSLSIPKGGSEDFNRAMTGMQARSDTKL
jgi:hypothetical protein